jgi:LysR family glycine cleavage system transcriptional activator
MYGKSVARVFMSIIAVTLRTLLDKLKAMRSRRIEISTKGNLAAKMPLRAVQAFEAVGRCGSVSAAAQELGVSPGAITQQIHLLERFLDFRLVQRSGRGIQLTSWGAMYLPHVRGAMEQLRKGGRELAHARESNHLRVSALPSLTNRWLGPLLFEWKALRPETSVLLEGSDPEPQLEEGEADFRISYGPRRRLHKRYIELFTDFVIPVGSPELVTGVRSPVSPRDLLKFPLLWIDWGPEYVAPPNWGDWFTALDVYCDHLRRDVTFSLSSAALDAAVEGRGLVLAQYSMVASALAAGTLVRLSERSLPLPESYFLAWNGSAVDKPLGAAFHTWLTAEGRRIDCQVRTG